MPSPKENADTPRATFALFSWQTNAVVVASLLVVSILAWLRTVEDARSMSDMVMGLGHVGTRFRGEMGAVAFLVMWTVMMVAMMLPTVAPMVLAHLAVVRRQRSSAFATVLFVAGYLAVWAVSGFVPYLAQVGFSSLTADAAQSRWLPMLAGAILVVAGAYQFTRWKQVCLGYCQSPFGFILTHDFGGGWRSALRAGIDHGAFCLGCCWALMAVLFVVGLMNLVWMVVLFVVFLIEKNSRHGLAVAKATGAALVVLGVAVVVRPSILPAISSAGGGALPRERREVTVVASARIVHLQAEHGHHTLRRMSQRNPLADGVAAVVDDERLSGNARARRAFDALVEDAGDRDGPPEPVLLETDRLLFGS